MLVRNACRYCGSLRMSLMFANVKFPWSSLNAPKRTTTDGRIRNASVYAKNGRTPSQASDGRRRRVVTAPAALAACASDAR
jgi:hypothetical protein